MRRREFITLLGGAAATWPLAARAQRGERIRRVGVLNLGVGSDLEFQARVAAFREGLAKLGWLEDHNLQLELRFGGGDISVIRALAAELVSLAPDVIVVGSAAATRAVQQQTQSIPIVFVTAGDPLAGGLVHSLGRPEGNTTGFTNLYTTLGGKWLQLLKEAAPGIARVAIIYNPDISTGIYFDSIMAAASLLTIPVIKTPYRNAAELEHAIAAFSMVPNGALLVVPPAPTDGNRELLLRLAAQHRLPAIYPSQNYAVDGGLMTYGVDTVDLWRRATSYVDRLLRGAKPSDLPVEYPSKFELVINLKTAKALGLTIPTTLLATADVVVE